ncbi:MAG TPA: ACT domain-containing protein [Terriglobales bacterium]|nr:ACT domain-containing protein [Terriglobales bacterium]
MNTTLVLTVIGEDRPGLVESLSHVIAGHGGSWLESRMARLAGKFAGILRASVPADQCETVTAELGRLEQRGLKVTIERSDETEAPKTTRRLKLELIGDDHPGIVREIARALAERGINVEELHTELVSAPMSGDVLFKASALLAAPASLSVDALRDKLEELANDLVVDVTLADA